MNLNDVFNSSQYDEAYRFISENKGTTIIELEPRLEEVKKTREVETIEKQEQIIPAEYDEEGNIIKEETVEIIEVPVIKEETYTVEELARYYQIVELPKPTLDELKTAKRTEINQARDAAEQGGFEYLDRVFDSDQVSCQRISMAAQAMSMTAMSEQTPTITWTCKDNSTIKLNAQQLAGLIVALAEWSSTCHQKATELKAKIEACTTEDELNQIVWEK